MLRTIGSRVDNRKQKLSNTKLENRPLDCELSWLRHYATSRKVAGSIPDEVIGFF
jgi:hypothetical protein